MTETGNIIKAIKTEYRNSECHIQKLSQDQYVLKKTGEVYDVNHSENRKDNLDSLRKSFTKLKDIINTNCTVAENIRWCTLTYAENMTDHIRLYEDYRRFWQRFKRYLKRNHISVPEYVCVAEPQGRAAWHCHILLIWQEKAPYIDNREFQEIWSHGFTDIRAVKEVDNFGSYLSAYVSDIPLDDITDSGLSLTNLKEVKKIKGKLYAKGSRLHLYPPGMKLFRCSKGIKKPVVYTTTNREFMEVINREQIPMTHEKSLILTGYKNNYIPTSGGYQKFGEHPCDFKVNIRYYNRSEIAKRKYYLVEIHRKSKLRRDMWNEFCSTPYTLEYPPLFDANIESLHVASEYLELINESKLEKYYYELDLAEQHRK